MKFSFKNAFYTLAFIVGLFAVMIFAKVILIPLSLALLISFILLPVVQKLEGWGLNNLLSAFLSILLLVVIIGGSISLLSAQIMNLSNQLSDLTGKLMNTLSDVLIYINKNVNFAGEINNEEIVTKGKKWLSESSGSLVKTTFSSTTSLLTGLFTSIIFTFLFLIYRKGLTHAIVEFGDNENKSRIFRMLKNIKSVGKDYLTGMFLLILVLGVVNSIGLWVIGIDNPFLFGFLAAFLSIIPYIGTAVGALIPILYVFMTADSIWTTVAVIVMFWVIQVIESNFLNPKIVGRSLNVNALVAILSLLIGASVWGIAGMVLFLPFAAILKVICEEFEPLKPIAMLISSDISGDDDSATASKWVRKIKRWFKKD